MSMRFLQAMQATNRMLISIWEPCPALLVAFVACNAFLLPFPLLCLSGSSFFSGSRSIVTHDVLSSELFSSLLPFEWSGQTGACNVILLPRCLKEYGARLCPGQTIGGNCCKLPLAIFGFRHNWVDLWPPRTSCDCTSATSSDFN